MDKEDVLLTIRETEMNVRQKPLVTDEEMHGFHPWTYVIHTELFRDKNGISCVIVRNWS